MAKSVEIPQEIIDSIIAAVGDNRVLKQCTLVSSSFLLPSRKQLFSKIIIRNNKTCQGIYQFLIQNPVIQSSVGTITLRNNDYNNCKWINGTSLPAILRLPFCHLKCFSIMGWGTITWNWNNFSSELKDALLNIIHSSSLKILSLNYIIEFPITFLLQVVHLTTLELYYLWSIDFDNAENTSSLTSKGVAPMASHAVIDQCVWYLSEIELGGFNKLIFLPFMCRLQFFEIDIELGSATIRDFEILSLLMGSLSISLTSPATLQHLKLVIRFRGSDHMVDHDGLYEDLHNAEVWSHLESITSHLTGSQLQRVDIDISCAFRYDDQNNWEPDPDKVLEVVLDRLPLLRAKGILFLIANGVIMST